MRNIVITGVSTGIGLGCARAFIKNGDRVFGSVRREKDAQKLEKELGANFQALIFDVTDESAIKLAANKVKSILHEDPLHGLINNAGIAKYGPLMHLPIEDLRYQMEVNLIGQIAVTQAFLPMLGASLQSKNDAGRILMMSSVSGKFGYPFLGPYVASKFALEGISDTLRRELQLFGIKVILLEPGRINSKIWYKIDKDVIDAIRKTDYSNSIDHFSTFLVSEGRKGIDINVFGNRVLKIFNKKNPKTRYVIIPNRFKNWTLPKFLPDKLLDKIIGKRLGLIKIL